MTDGEQEHPTAPLPPWGPPDHEPPAPTQPLGTPGPPPEPPASPAPPYDQPPDSRPPYGQPQYGQPQYGQAPSTQPLYGQPAYGQPAYGQPAYGQPPYGRPEYGQPMYGQPPYGEAPYAQVPYGAPSVPPSRGRRFLWIVGMGVAVLVLLLAGVSVAAWHWLSAGTSTSAGRAPTGGGQSGGAAPGPTGSRDAATTSWLAATNAYCRTTTDPDLKRAAPLAATDPAAYFTQVAAVNRQLDALLRRNPPAGLRPQVEQVASAWDQMASLMDQAVTALRNNDRAGAAQLLDQSDTANQRGNDLATGIGLQDCADAGGIGVTAGPSGGGPTV